MAGVSIAGLVGAAVGLGLGWIDYRVVSGVVVGRLRKLDRSQTPQEKDEFERRIRILRGVLFVLTIGAFPVIGYLLGVTVAGG
ncbi:hypothetical protein [Alsobacter sp. R-9]